MLLRLHSVSCTSWKGRIVAKFDIKSLCQAHHIYYHGDTIVNVGSRLVEVHVDRMYESKFVCVTHQGSRTFKTFKDFCLTIVCL